MQSHSDFDFEHLRKRADSMKVHGLSEITGGGPDDPAWARAIQDRCRTYEVPFFFKQSAGQRPGTNPTLDGEVIQEFPRPRITKDAHPL